MIRSSKAVWRVVCSALSNSMTKGAIVGQSEPTHAGLADVWLNPDLPFVSLDIASGPVKRQPDLTMPMRAASLQAAVNAIRKA